MAEDSNAQVLEQFCLLAKNLKGRACVGIIQQVVNHPKIFVFGELLTMPNIQALQGTEHEPYLKLLELFAFGTVKEYKANISAFPELTETQWRKLRQLTIVSLAQHRKVVAYDTLFEELGVENVRALEDLIIDTIYMGLVKGKLDQQSGIFRVKQTIGRDFRVEQVNLLEAKLRAWNDLIQQVLDGLDQTADLRMRTQEQERKSQSDLMTQIKQIQTQDLIEEGNLNDPHGYIRKHRPPKLGFKNRAG